jgi:hypothetical protein
METTTINGLMRALVDELAAEGVPAPLGEAFTLAAVWLDLCRLAGETVPTEVLAVLDGGRVELAAD